MTLINEIFDAHVKATDRIFPDRSRIVGASEIGQCARKIWWTKRGAAPDPDYSDSWGARVRGSVYEAAFWAPAMKRRYGASLKMSGVNQMTLTSGHLSATPDAIVVDQPRDALASLGVPDIESDCFLAECKTADPRTNLADPKPEHYLQVHVQLGLVREKTAYKPMYALLTYADASFWHEMRAFAIGFSELLYVNAKNRAAQIINATAFDDLPPEGWIAGGKECERCPFASPCGHNRTSVPRDGEEIDTQFAAEIADLARQAKDEEAEINATTIGLRQIQNAIRDRLREHGVRRIKSGDVTVIWSAVKGRQAWDNTALREAAAEAGIDVEKFSTVGEPTDRLLIRIG